VDDELLQDEPLQVRVLDHDTYSAHDAIGKVYIDIDPLLHPDSSHFLGGWFPIYDTMHGNWDLNTAKGSWHFCIIDSESFLVYTSAIVILTFTLQGKQTQA